MQVYLALVRSDPDIRTIRWKWSAVMVLSNLVCVLQNGKKITRAHTHKPSKHTNRRTTAEAWATKARQTNTKTKTEAMKSNKQWLIKSKLSNLFKFCFGFSWNILMPGALDTRQSWLRYACNSNTKAKKNCQNRWRNRYKQTENSSEPN